MIAHPKAKELRAELQRREQQKIDAEIHSRLKEKRLEIPGWHEAIRRLEEFAISGQSQQELDALNEAGPKEQAWLSAATLMRLDWDNSPNFIDIPVLGESAFLVARKVWQAALCAYFVAQARKGTISFHSRLMPLKFSLTFPTRTEFSVLRQNMEFLTDSQKAALPSATDSIIAYLDALVDLGYLKKDNIYYYLQKGAPSWNGD